MSRILVADDDVQTCDFFREILHDLPSDVVTCDNPQDAIHLATSERFDVVVSDINFEQALNGLDVLRAVRQDSPGTAVILVSGFGTLDTALAAVREGAFDYVSKPFNVDEVRSTVRRALEKKEGHRRRVKPSELEEAEAMLVGSSPKMLAVYKNIAYVADSKTTVLLQGESGTGKELVARAIHAKGPRASRPFLAINCGALTETLLESELFGHVKGSFTGAVSDKQGLLQAATGGTIFFDEISETSPALQVKLLRVLQEEEYTPVGSTRVVKSDVRVIAATNQDLERLVKEEKFREDLYYRLNVVTIVVPPLRERAEDIPRLVAHFCRLLGSKTKVIPQFTSRAVDALVRYSWPGNVRELENTIERLALFVRDREVDVGDLPERIRARDVSLDKSLFEGIPSLEEMERRYLLHVLDAMGGNRTRAAEALKIDRRTLYRMLDRFGISARAEVAEKK